MPASAGRLEPVCPVEEHPTAPGVEIFPSRLKEVLPELGRESAQGNRPADAANLEGIASDPEREEKNQRVAPSVLIGAVVATEVTDAAAVTRPPAREGYRADHSIGIGEERL